MHYDLGRVKTSKDHLGALATQIRDISTLPHIAIQVINIVNDPRSSAADLKAVVESDPALAARVLRAVNSAAYGLKYEVTTILNAISLLGFHEVKNLVLAASVVNLFQQDVRIGPYTRQGLWRHLVSVAIAARMVAARAGSVRFEEAFLGGLLHDLGLILLDQHFHRSFAKILGHLQPGTSLCEVERHRLGFDHAELGARVAETWGFPGAIVAAIRYHHRAESYRGEHRVIVQAVETANFLCAFKGIDSIGIPHVNPPSGSILEALSFDRHGLKVLCEDLDQELVKAQAMITL